MITIHLASLWGFVETSFEIFLIISQLHMNNLSFYLINLVLNVFVSL